MLKQVRLNILKMSTSKIFKFGVEVPRNYEDALRLDKENENNLLAEAVKKEFDQLEDYETYKDMRIDATVPEGYKKIKVHLVFDCKHDFRRKERLVAGGHMAPGPEDTTYSSMVLLQSLRMIMFIGELNGMQICSGDLDNAYLEAYTPKKV